MFTNLIITIKEPKKKKRNNNNNNKTKTKTRCGASNVINLISYTCTYNINQGLPTKDN